MNRSCRPIPDFQILTNTVPAVMDEDVTSVEHQELESGHDRTG